MINHPIQSACERAVVLIIPPGQTMTCPQPWRTKMCGCFSSKTLFEVNIPRLNLTWPPPRFSRIKHSFSTLITGMGDGFRVTDKSLTQAFHVQAYYSFTHSLRFSLTPAYSYFVTRSYSIPHSLPAELVQASWTATSRAEIKTP
jgi:hypothetical protein